MLFTITTIILLKRFIIASVMVGFLQNIGGIFIKFFEFCNITTT
ncbi:putative membrane protein [Candidatus Neoehrlichia lotoris str. RAC413]|uniref:Putative membrane protein n=1 Tax=Candidatus Neoehrlichia procyonis str. RAC413 TaxID=1359163 RepID=A0A0F3NNR0_9RICK|nr:putative membrane protein [Candidatus Neoehrlichia lotoris str. RAC413]